MEPCPNMGGPPSKPKYSLATDSEPVHREGKVKSSATSAVKQTLSRMPTSSRASLSFGEGG